MDITCTHVYPHIYIRVFTHAWLCSQPPAEGTYLHTSASRTGKLACSGNILLLSVTDDFLYLLPWNAISLSRLFFFFSPFNSKAGLEKQRYHYSLCKNVSICKRLMKKEKKNLPSFTLTSPTLTPRNVFKQLHLRRAAANALTNSRLTTANTVLMACEDVLQLPHTPRPLGASPAARDPWVMASLPSLVTLHHKDQADSLLLTS